MKDIIIVGTSKAAFLHFKSYNKLSNVGKIFFTDIKENASNKNIKTKKIYKSIIDTLSQNNLNSNNIIVDICTPKEEFYNIINQCISLGINNIIVEKPFMASKDFFNQYPNLHILMVQNYLYSNIISEIKKKIEENNFNIKLIYTNFSKNRINDSINRRGMSKKNTQNFEIEIPHQIYLADYILGESNKKEIIFKEQKDFIIDNICIEKHGYGKILLEYDDKIVIHESDLVTNNTIKEITIVCDEGVVIKGQFILYDKDLNKIKNGKVVIHKYQNIIWEKEFEEDDNMYYCLKEYYENLNNTDIPKKYRNRILEFSNIFGRIIE